jgi:hypothetical protein
MLIESWLAAAIADAERRGMPGLKPMLETLARSTAALRAADARVSGSAAQPEGRAPADDDGAPDVRGTP